ncbi:MAG: DUF2723 domain-containing protein [Chitinophagaceae bacterium]
MNFKKINNLTGWIVCLIACTVYIMTAEAGGSLWDCGEFVSSCYKLQVPHPPGAPLFVLIGRVFIVLFGDNPLTAAKAVNIMSALASGFTILFLFWSITHFGRKIIAKGKPDGVLSMGDIWTVMGAGAVGALAYTFSDSFWYSAVEGEVYALSSFFTALVFWSILKWEQAAEKDDALRREGKIGVHPDRWLVFLFFMMGLSIGVHLLNLLCIPAIVMVYYYKRFKTTGWGTFWAFVVGCVITGFVQKVMIQYTIDGAGYTDIFAVNSLGLPFFSGFAIYFILMAVLIALGLRFKAEKFNRNLFIGWFVALMLLLSIPFIAKGSGGEKFLGLLLAVGGGGLAGYLIKASGLKTLKLALWCIAFMLIGYSSYLTTMIRSNANTAIDMYNVDNPMSLVGYLGREQYGDFPLLYGQKFTASPISYKNTYTKYQKGKDKYFENGQEGHYEYNASQMMLFPRVWDASNDQGHADYYASFLGIEKVSDQDKEFWGDEENQKHYPYERDPNGLDNLNFFIRYQNYYMYFRYFMWNFSGKQNDVQWSAPGNLRDGNWITGISFIDDLMYGDQSKMPDSLKNNKAHNKLFMLPFILGLIGMFYHWRKHNKDFLINFLLFFFTGFAIVIYLNQAGNQPRERDYAYVGSFYAFAVWIGLGVLQVRDWFGKKINPGASGAIASLICLLAVPALMASQEWNDHDRSKKVLARDLARNYLESCAPNAILFSFGDNDTYPLWYAQEVEGIRRDIRVINYSLLGIDWYVNQLRYKINSSDAMNVVFTTEQFEGRNRDYIRYQANGEQTAYRDLDSTLRNWVGSDDPNKKMAQGEEMINTFPTHRFSIPVPTDLNQLRADSVIGPKDTAVLPVINFEVSRNTLMKNDLAVLGVIAGSKWKRPIYFTNPSTEGLGLDAYLRRDGMSYRLVPMANAEVNPDWMLDKVMNKFSSGNANKPGVYFDEENRRHLNNIRQAYADLANYLGQADRKDDGRKVLEKLDKLMLEENMPYGMVSRYQQQNRTSLMVLEAAYRNDYKELAAKISKSVKTDLDQQMTYYAALGDMSRQELDAVLGQYFQMSQGARTQQEKSGAEQYLYGAMQKRQPGMTQEIVQAFQLLATLNQMENQYNKPATPVETANPVIKQDSGPAKPAPAIK